MLPKQPEVLSIQLKTLPSLSLDLVMLYMRLDHKLPTDFRDKTSSKIRTDDGLMEDGRQTIAIPVAWTST